MFPRRRLWRIGASLAWAILVLAEGTAARAATMSVSVLTADGHPLTGAVVAVSGGGGARPATPVQGVMDQINKTFQPDVLVIPIGSTVEFPNSDTVSHQIYSFSAARRFQLPLYRGKPYPPVHFDQAGLVTLGCNIHDSMLGYILVTDAPWFGRTNTAGLWTVEVASGTYTVRIWHPRMRERPAIERKVALSDTGAQLQVKLSEALRPQHLDGQRAMDAY
jgi:plastocyanin